MIDLEGAELDVLSSATYVVSTFRPTIIMEYGTNTWPPFGVTSNDLKSIAHQYRYVLRLFDPRKKALIPVPDEF
jgi:hypothetical protein